MRVLPQRRHLAGQQTQFQFKHCAFASGRFERVQIKRQYRGFRHPTSRTTAHLSRPARCKGTASAVRTCRRIHCPLSRDRQNPAIPVPGRRIIRAQHLPRFPRLLPGRCTSFQLLDQLVRQPLRKIARIHASFLFWRHRSSTLSRASWSLSASS
jgi:hypothetical protein